MICRVDQVGDRAGSGLRRVWWLGDVKHGLWEASRVHDDSCFEVADEVCALKA